MSQLKCDTQNTYCVNMPSKAKRCRNYCETQEKRLYDNKLKLSTTTTLIALNGNKCQLNSNRNNKMNNSHRKTRVQVDPVNLSLPSLNSITNSVLILEPPMARSPPTFDRREVNVSSQEPFFAPSYSTPDNDPMVTYEIFELDDTYIKDEHDLPTSSCPPSRNSEEHLLNSKCQKGANSSFELTQEEEKMLLANGYHLPTQLSLRKVDELTLKNIRRRISNRKSAHESRRRKKQHMDELESKVQLLWAENTEYQARIQSLEEANAGLKDELSKVKAVLNRLLSEGEP